MNFRNDIPVLLVATFLALITLFAFDASSASAQTTTVYVAADIADCSGRSDSVADFLDANPGPFIAPGDIAYPDGSDADFANCYDPRFGVHKARTYPAIGNHEYYTPDATGYFNYFGARAGDPDEGWYAVDIGGWQVISLNSSCWLVGGCHPGSPQYQWLEAELASRPTACRIAQWHHPRFTSSSTNADHLGINPLYELLYDAGTDIALQGHAHQYERFEPLNASGNADPDGIRNFIVGTGGANVRSFDSTTHFGSEIRESGTFGLLQLDLSATGYTWDFHATGGPGFTDTGSDTCINSVSTSAVAPSACTATASGTDAASITWTPAANDNAVSYVLRRQRNGGTWYWAGRVDAPATSITNANLSSGSTYQFLVEALGADGTRASTTCGGSVTLDSAGSPVAPSSCLTTRDNAAATVTVVPSANDQAVAYIVERSRNGGTFYWAGRITPPSVDFINGGLDAGSTYEYRVKTLNAEGVASATQDCDGVAVQSSPLAVADCSATSVGANDALIEWNRVGDDNATHFVIYRQRDGGTWWWAARVDATATSWTNAGLSGGTFNYRIETLAGSDRSAAVVCDGSITP